MIGLVIILLGVPAILLAVLWLQGQWIRRRVPRLPEASGRRDGQAEGNGPALRMLIVGESPAVGVGLADIRHSVSVQTAEQLAEQTGRSLRWSVRGYSGARLQDLHRLCENRSDLAGIDLLLLVVGVNDATGLFSRAAFRVKLGHFLERFWRESAQLPVVLAGIPPLADFPALPRPLSLFLGWRASRLDSVLEVVAANDRRLRHLPCGAVAVDEFAADGFHPDDRASARWARELAVVCHEMLKSADAGSDCHVPGGGSDNCHKSRAGGSGNACVDSRSGGSDRL